VPGWIMAPRSRRYRAIAAQIDRYYRDLLRPLDALQTQLETILGLPQATKAEEPFRFNRARQRATDAAIDTYLEELAGPDRSEEGFVQGGIESDTPDGVIQQHNVMAYAVGLQRGSDLLNRAQTVTAARNNPATERMLENAFARLSSGGQMRLETVRDDIHGILAGGAEAGLSPLAVGRQLADQFDAYSRYEFQRLARTEAAYASEEGVRAQLEDLGVTAYQVLVDASACAICQGYVGQVIAADDLENLPPAHPNCACSSAPAGVGELLIRS
jgi:SPP1 gp7 family putative phage head morphogenesis protein